MSRQEDIGRWVKSVYKCMDRGWMMMENGFSQRVGECI